MSYLSNGCYKIAHPSKPWEYPSLPLSISHMSVLKELVLYFAGKLQSLPDLLVSLRRLCIRLCHPDLEKKIRCGRPEWYKISRVQAVQLGNRYFILGKECSKDTYYDLRDQDFDTFSSWANRKKVSITLPRNFYPGWGIHSVTQSRAYNDANGKLYLGPVASPQNCSRRMMWHSQLKLVQSFCPENTLSS